MVIDASDDQQAQIELAKSIGKGLGSAVRAWKKANKDKDNGKDEQDAKKQKEKQKSQAEKQQDGQDRRIEKQQQEDINPPAQRTSNYPNQQGRRGQNFISRQAINEQNEKNLLPTLVATLDRGSAEGRSSEQIHRDVLDVPNKALAATNKQMAYVNDLLKSTRGNLNQYNQWGRQV